MTHFTAANLLDASITFVGLNLPPVHEGGLIHQLSPSMGDQTLILLFKCLVTIYPLSAYALSKKDQMGKMNYATEKAMQITTPAIYVVAAWNLVLIGLQMFY